MMLGTVVRRVWSDRQLPSFDGRRLVLVATDEAAAAATGDATVDAAVVALVAEPSAEQGRGT